MSRVVTLLQSMRVAEDFENCTALGGQYLNSLGENEWHISLWSQSDTTVNVYWVVNGEFIQPPSGKSLEAIRSAIARWEAAPVWADGLVGSRQQGSSCAS